MKFWEKEETVSKEAVSKEGVPAEEVSEEEVSVSEEVVVQGRVLKKKKKVSNNVLVLSGSVSIIH